MIEVSVEPLKISISASMRKFSKIDFHSSKTFQACQTFSKTGPTKIRRFFNISVCESFLLSKSCGELQAILQEQQEPEVLSSHQSENHKFEFFFSPPSDQNEVQIMSADYDYSGVPCSPNVGTDQFDDAENCGNCKGSDFRPPACLQCCAPSSTKFAESRQCETPFNASFASQRFTANQSERNFESSCFPNYDQRSFKQECEPCVTACDPCDPCVQRCDPCEPLGPCPMPCEDVCQPRYPCPPLNTCSPMCSPYNRRRYLQPPRRESCKPLIRHQRPSVPMTSDTIYKESFDLIDAATAASCRLPPVFPSGQLRTPCGNFEKETITKVRSSEIPFTRPTFRLFYFSSRFNRVAALSAQSRFTRILAR